jgi:twitching motility two-component system response regulator PilH
MLQREQPVLVLLDLWLEERTTGEMVLDSMKRDPATRSIPVVVISGHLHALRGAVRRIERRGCVVLEKPFTLDELFGAIDRAIGTLPPA